MKQILKEAVYIINYLLRKIKLKLGIDPTTVDQYQLFKEAEPGDIIWCQMDLPLKKLLKIPYNHRFRPYLVLNKNKIHLYTYPMTSAARCKKLSLRYFKTSAKGIGSYIDYKKLAHIKPYQLLYKYGVISQKDAMLFNRTIEINKKKSRPILPNIPTVSCGDVIIIDKKYYYVSEVCDDVYRTIQLHLGEGKQSKQITLNSTHLYCHDTTLTTIPRTSDYAEIFGTCSAAQMKRMNLIQMNLKKDAEIEKTPVIYNLKFNIGTVLEHKYSGYKLVYLYSVNDKDFGAWATGFFQNKNRLYKITPNEFKVSKVDLNLTLNTLKQLKTLRKRETRILAEIQQQIEINLQNSKQ